MGKNPTDRGTLGTKRSVLTDGHGLPLGVAVDGATRHDMKLVEATLEASMIKRPELSATPPQPLCLDQGYDDAAVRATLEVWGYTAPMRGRGEEQQAKYAIPGAPLGGRASALLDAPLSAVAHSVGAERGQLSGVAPLCVCLDHVSSR